MKFLVWFFCCLLLNVGCGESDPCEDDDKDGDGAVAIICGGTDCDDFNPNRFPGNNEICDSENVDEDCDASTFGDTDADGDGVVSDLCCNDIGGSLTCGRDCDDQRPTVNPNTSESCNDIDDDCDQSIDEGTLVSGFLDMDGDGFGDSTMPVENVCAGTAMISINDDDCFDGNAQVFPGAIVCVENSGEFSSIYNICNEDGEWIRGSCDNDRQCFSQPGGHGICAYF